MGYDRQESKGSHFRISAVTERTTFEIKVSALKKMPRNQSNLYQNIKITPRFKA